MDGDDVFAGTDNLTGIVEVEVERTGTATAIEQVRHLLVAASKAPTGLRRELDRYASHFAIIVTMIAVTVFVATQNFNSALAALLICFPDALFIAEPAALVAALTSASRLGVLIRDHVAFRKLASCTAILFDKTGTLTDGHLEVRRLHCVPGVSPTDLAHIQGLR
jgi:Cd2+/Zn2+-exporting ATPase